MNELRIDGPPSAVITLLLAHGAGAGMDSPFMAGIAERLGARGLRVVRFEFGYMNARRLSGKRKPPPRAETLDGEFVDFAGRIANSTPSRKLAIGGKSMGGRVASHVADRLQADGLVGALVCLGYPFHPPKMPEKLRTEHLRSLRCPALVVQGERDPFGSRPEVEAMDLSPAIRLAWAVDGDHDLGPRGASGATRKENLDYAADTIAAFLQSTLAR